MTMPTHQPPLLEARGLHKQYVGGDGSSIEVLTGVDLRVAPGEFVAIVGASGCGKSTLLHLLGALDHASAGEVSLEGQPYRGLGREALAALRNQRIGFIFQFHHLLREFSALENVMMPLRIAGVAEGDARRQAEGLLEVVGLKGRSSHRPAALSGGEQQRVAAARALAANPAIVLADEPSGNLDEANSEVMHALLVDVVRGGRRALIVVTHNGTLARQADRVLTLEGGRLVEMSGASAVVEATR